MRDTTRKQNGRHRTFRAGEFNSAAGTNGAVQEVELGTNARFSDIDPRWDEERPYNEEFGPPDPHRRPLRLNGTKCG